MVWACPGWSSRIWWQVVERRTRIASTRLAAARLFRGDRDCRGHTEL
jgi:hypothetical protein